MAPRTIYEAPRVDPREGETVVTSTCGHNCGGRCVVNAHVVDGRIVKISTDPRKWTFELPPLHACVRGFGQVERVYHPDRLKQPLRRTGPRGSGRFEPISWDAALDEVAREMLRIRDVHGNAAILDASRSGNLSMLHNRAAAQRFLYMFGGCTELWSNMSAEAEIFAVRMTYGAKAEYKSAGREPTDYRQLEADRDVGLEPGRRDVRHEHACSTSSGPGSRACGSSASTPGRPDRAASWPTSTSSSGRPPTPPRSSRWRT